METKTIKVYEFNELNPKIQRGVLNRFREEKDFPFLLDDLNETLSLKLKENKIKPLENPKLYYSLSYCQGDGLSFVGLFKWKNYLVRIKQGHLSNLYSHKYTTDFFIETEKGNEPKKSDKVEEEFKKIYYKICDEVEKTGYNIIEGELSDEAIKEDINLNGFKFRENGDIEI